MLDARPQASEQRTTGWHRREGAGDRKTFFLHWLKNPLGIAAVLPSGERVARAMARELRLDQPGVILELGGGTGGVTRGLLAAGCPVERLCIIEREFALARHLARNFPGTRVLCGDACASEQLLTVAGIDRIATVISSLPIKWFPREAQRSVLAACFARLGPHGALVQLTNALSSPIPAEELGLIATEVARIWAHFLPVQIWRYEKPHAASAKPRC